MNKVMVKKSAGLERGIFYSSTRRTFCLSKQADYLFCTIDIIGALQSDLLAFPEI